MHLYTQLDMVCRRVNTCTNATKECYVIYVGGKIRRSHECAFGIFKLRRVNSWSNIQDGKAKKEEESRIVHACATHIQIAYSQSEIAKAEVKNKPSDTEQSSIADIVLSIRKRFAGKYSSSL